MEYNKIDDENIEVIKETTTTERIVYDKTALNLSKTKLLEQIAEIDTILARFEV